VRAATYSRRGPAVEVLSVRDVPTPEPGPGEVRVRVRYSGVNPTDWKARAHGGPLSWPFQVPGQDGAGEVDAVGAGVDPTRVGERVWVYHAADLRPYGTCAQFTVVPAAQAVPLPPTATYEQGAGLGIPYLTAHACVLGDGSVDGRTVLVTGGAGAVGHAAVELAHRDGATVVATASTPEKAVLALAAGADAVLDYRAPDFAARLREAAPDGVHRVVDVALGANLASYVESLRPHATVVTYASEGTDPTVPTRALMTLNVSVRFVLVYTLAHSQLAQGVADVTAALEDAALQPLPTHVYALDDVAAAHDAVEGGAVGKVLVRID
jgi:NADPH:quinone reductase